MSYNFHTKPRGIRKEVAYGDRMMPLPRRFELERDSIRDINERASQKYRYNEGKLTPDPVEYYGTNPQNYFKDGLSSNAADMLKRSAIQKINSTLYSKYKEPYLSRNYESRKERKDRRSKEIMAMRAFAYGVPYEQIHDVSDVIVFNKKTGKYEQRILPHRKSQDIREDIVQNIASFFDLPQKVLPEHMSDTIKYYRYLAAGVKPPGYLPLKLEWGDEDEDAGHLSFNDFFRNKYGQEYPEDAYPNDEYRGEWGEDKKLLEPKDAPYVYRKGESDEVIY